MFSTSTKKVPALLREKVKFEDSVTVTLTRGSRNGYMVKDEFEHDMEHGTVKVFASESAAKSYAQGQRIVEVTVTCKNQ